jgi:hypothetical protein
MVTVAMRIAYATHSISKKYNTTLQKVQKTLQHRGFPGDPSS